MPPLTSSLLTPTSSIPPGSHIIDEFDKILCKKPLLGKTYCEDRIKNIDVKGWKSPDRYENIEKDFSSFFLLVGVSVYRQLKDILNLWKEDYPKLTILCGKNYLNNHQIEKKEQNNIEYLEEYLKKNLID